MSSGRHRFIVNSGSPKFAGRRYVQMARTTAAHSTVTLNDTSSSRFSPSEFLGHLIIDPVKTVSVERAETEDGRDVIKVSHDGYLRNFGVLHERELTLNAAGSIVTGRDRLVRQGERISNEPLRAAARFHIHPAHQCEAERPRVRVADGAGWRKLALLVAGE